MSKKTYLYLIIIIFLPLYSCNKHKMVNNDLGNDYYLTISYIENKRTLNSVGKIVIPPTIDSIAYNDTYIIASVIDDTRENNYYWIIDKSLPKGDTSKIKKGDLFRDYYVYDNCYGPLTLKQFHKKMIELKVFDLKLESLNRKIVDE